MNNTLEYEPRPDPRQDRPWRVSSWHVISVIGLTGGILCFWWLGGISRSNDPIARLGAISTLTGWIGWGGLWSLPRKGVALWVIGCSVAFLTLLYVVMPVIS